MIKKFIVILVLGAALYYGGKFFMIMRFSQLVSECGDYSVVLEMNKNHTPMPEKLKYSAKFWTCVHEKQTIVDALFFNIPEAWLSPPVQQ